MRGWLRVLSVLAGLMGAAGVGLAAVGAHLSAQPAVATAATFLLLHAGLVVALCALAAATGPTPGVLAAASLAVLGSTLFSGEIALHALLGVTGIGKAAPIGGSLAILAWLFAAASMPLALRP